MFGTPAMLYIGDGSQYDAPDTETAAFRGIWPSILLVSGKRMQLLYLLIFILAWTAAPGGAFAQEKSAQALPIHIEADRMESYQNKNEVLFLGRVEAQQGGAVIHADEMTVTYLPAGKENSKENGKENGAEAEGGKSQRIDKVYAKGDVRVTNEGWVATGQTLDFFAKERKAILTGDARAWQDNNLVTGDRIILYLDEGKTVVEPNEQAGQRVTATVYPDSKPETKPEINPGPAGAPETQPATSPETKPETPAEQ
ncbi:MAG: lipopolysaccharide transport periplasmic protein LptA [Desulfobacteraceae bacterium]|nr:lipopolysaccharide transport periplasmic protein LptA [Desulfobacteraceae bacterium]